MENGSATLSLLNKVCNSIYYSTIPRSSGFGSRLLDPPISACYVIFTFYSLYWHPSPLSHPPPRPRARTNTFGSPPFVKGPILCAYKFYEKIILQWSSILCFVLLYEVQIVHTLLCSRVLQKDHFVTLSFCFQLVQLSEHRYTHLLGMTPQDISLKIHVHTQPKVQHTQSNIKDRAPPPLPPPISYTLPFSRIKKWQNV